MARPDPDMVRISISKIQVPKRRAHHLVRWPGLEGFEPLAKSESLAETKTFLEAEPTAAKPALAEAETAVSESTSPEPVASEAMPSEPAPPESAPAKGSYLGDRNPLIEGRPTETRMHKEWIG
ncbi:MAG: hypothetical protein QNJ92_11910 [Alphaproteobacteria bacterium]|nr:hypothetical protein [Alphaproteobacteria bacterium]